MHVWQTDPCFPCQPQVRGAHHVRFNASNNFAVTFTGNENKYNNFDFFAVIHFNAVLQRVWLENSSGMINANTTKPKYLQLDVLIRTELD